MGLCFSVPDGIKVPPSLKNIYKEMEDDLGITINTDCGDLTHWVEQGVLLLNTALTVQQYKSNNKSSLKHIVNHIKDNKISDNPLHKLFRLIY